MNMQAIMQQAKKMQKDINQKKDELTKKEFIGKSELVDIKFSGDKKVISTTIKENITNEDKEILEDMIMIAINDAMKKIDKETDNMLGAYGSQLNGLF